MTPTQKSEGPPQPVDTSSQVSIEEAEASLEDIPTNISPIAAISGTRSVTPSGHNGALDKCQQRP